MASKGVVMVAGGTGFIGKKLDYRLMRSGYQTVIVTRKADFAGYKGFATWVHESVDRLLSTLLDCRMT